VTDDRTNKKIEGTIFQNEDMGIALQQFRCYKVDVQSLPDGDLKTRYLKRELGFHFFDPSGQPALRPLVGRRADSLSSFSSYVEKVWRKSYTMKLKDFQKQMKNVLDEMDRLDQQQQDIDRKAKRLEDRPNPRLQRELDKEKEEVAETRKQIDEMQKDVLSQCTLESEFLPAADGETGKND
jgi:vacuolar-type H+-ATPase subunit I/STV1